LLFFSAVDLLKTLGLFVDLCVASALLCCGDFLCSSLFFLSREFVLSLPLLWGWR
jgi:hypothetical protein